MKAIDPQTLFHRHGDRMRRFCYRLCGHWSDAEDLTQDVFLAACQSAGRFRGLCSETTWLYRIALNCWKQRRRAVRPTTALRDEQAAAVPDGAAAVLTRLDLACALNALPEDLRDVFLLVKAEGLTYREASQALGVPQGTLQWRVHEAVRRLRLLLAEEGETHDV